MIFFKIMNIKHKILIYFIILFTLNSNIFSQTKQISKEANDYIDSFMNFRMELTKYKDKKTAATEVQKYKNLHPYSSFTNQEKLIIDTFLLLEKYNYTWEDSSNNASLQNQLLNQINLNEKYITTNPAGTNEWLYVLTADTFSCYMSYNPVSGALKYGLKVKEYYEKCLSLNPKNSYCLTHYGQWFYWAPAVNGGSKKKAMSNFSLGLTYAKNNAEKFYAEIFMSQMYYDQKDKQSAKTHLDKAKTYCPASEYIKELENYNAEGYSLFTYSKKKAEDEKRVNN